MCGRGFTHDYTWAEIYAMYRLTSPPANIQPNFNVCPTDTVDVVVRGDDQRILHPMRWGLTPWLVEEAAQGNAGGDLQCAIGHDRYQADVSGVVPETTLAYLPKP